MLNMLYLKLQCAVCNRAFSSRVGIQKHINLSHNFSMSEYKAKYGNTCVKRVTHKCLICDTGILHDPSVIACHTRHRHKISFEEYFTQYIENGTVFGQNDGQGGEETAIAIPKIKKKKLGLLPLASNAQNSQQTVHYFAFKNIGVFDRELWLKVLKVYVLFTFKFCHFNFYMYIFVYF